MAIIWGVFWRSSKLRTSLNSRLLSHSPDRWERSSSLKDLKGLKDLRRRGSASTWDSSRDFGHHLDLQSA